MFVDTSDQPRRPLQRDEPWRLTHLRLLDKRLRAGGDGMSKAELQEARLNHSVSVPIGARYAPLTWDPSDERVAYALAYRPGSSPEKYLEHQSVIVDLVLRTPFMTLARDRELQGSLAALFPWAKSHRFSLDPQSLLCGDRIDAHIDQLDVKPASKNTYRWRLRFVASCVFPPAAETAITRNPVSGPHDDADIERFIVALGTLDRGDGETRIKRIQMVRDLTAILVLSFGAGCNGRIIHQVQESWLTHDRDGWWLHRPDRDIPTPILADWSAAIPSLLTGKTDRWLIRPDTPQDRGSQVGKALDKARRISPTFTDFDVNRAARHWQIRLLAQAQFPALAAALGYRSGSQTLGDLLLHTPEIDISQARETLRGWAP